MKVRAEDYRFSWSLRRRRLWNGCRRRYFLTYYAPRGGHDPAAEATLRQIHLAKSLLSRDSYCNILLRTAMRELFYRRNEEEDNGSGMELRSRVMLTFAREFNRMLLGFWQEDHRTPMLRALLAPAVSCETVRNELETRLKRSVEALEQNGWGEFRHIPPERRRPPPLAAGSAHRGAPLLVLPLLCPLLRTRTLDCGNGIRRFGRSRHAA